MRQVTQETTRGNADSIDKEMRGKERKNLRLGRTADATRADIL